MQVTRLPGFRDFYPEDCAWRNYVFDTWRAVARAHGFQEYDGPLLEPTDLYKKKSGEELKTQLFRFIDQGDRDVCLRPEMTPTLARLVAARERDYRKPLKWFSIAPFFRFEKPQKGRLREFYQINCDVIGDSSPAADAELIALAIALCRACGLSSQDFFVRVNDRSIWSDFLLSHTGSLEQLSNFLAVIDKIEREDEKTSAEKLASLQVDAKEVRTLIESPSQHPGLAQLTQELEWRGLTEFVVIDPRIVRGLDYYTGVVFEIFDRKRHHRALAGGGRYDRLIEAISDGDVNLPAAGFAIGDLTFQNLLQELPHTREQAERALFRIQVYLILTTEKFKPQLLQLAHRLRQAGVSVEYQWQPAKVGKQFQSAEALGARYAVLVGDEWPKLKIKNLLERSEETVLAEDLLLKLIPTNHVSHPSL